MVCSTPRLALAVVQHQATVRLVAVVQVLDGLLRRRCERLVHIEELQRDVTIAIRHTRLIVSQRRSAYDLVLRIELQIFVDETDDPADAFLRLDRPLAALHDRHIAGGVQQDVDCIECNKWM